jgi:5-methylcytosine-specific restriction endonuclease McrA
MKRTKKLREQLVRELIDRNTLNVPFSSEDVSYLASLCEQPITGAVRRVNPQFPGDPRHLHTEISGEWAARSWRKFIYPLNETQQAKRIMRAVIAEDMRDYASCAYPSECASCGSLDDLTVDHVAPPFDSIAADFIAENGIPKIEQPKDKTKILNRFDCIDLEAKWIAYHAQRACYQLLCRSCNSRKGKR